MTKLSKRKVLNAIKDSFGIVSTIALRCKVSRSHMSVYLHKEGNENLLKEINSERERVLDVAESALFQKISEKDFPSIKWLLATQGRHRGYITKQEIEHRGNEDNPVQIVIAGVDFEKSEDE